MDIAGTVAVVTGASSGIGEAVAIDLARRGATVVVTARRPDRLEATAQACRELGNDSFAVVADIASPDDCARSVAAAHERLGRVDILVNNAGISMHKHALHTAPDDVERVFRINFFGAVHTTMAALPGMVERRRGFVVNVTSVAAHVPNPKESAYAASKAALSMWSHTLSVDLHGTGVQAGVVSPGPIDTEIWDWDETPSSYTGRKYPPQVVADGVAKMIRREVAQLTVPRRFGAVGPLYSLPFIGRAVRRGLIGFEQRGEKRAARR